MITYEIKINGQTIKRIDARRVHGINEQMDEHGYLYRYYVYDYEKESFAEGIITHKRQNNIGKLLELIELKIKE